MWHFPAGKCREAILSCQVNHMAQVIKLTIKGWWSSSNCLLKTSNDEQGIAETLKNKEALWHKSCFNKFNNLKERIFEKGEITYFWKSNPIASIQYPLLDIDIIFYCCPLPTSQIQAYHSNWQHCFVICFLCERHIFMSWYDWDDCSGHIGVGQQSRQDFVQISDTVRFLWSVS